MSRCFPFPPPGYERKTRNDDGNLLEKEKHRDKKPKKDKKDKDKREGKEKRDKDRSDGKHREKKDKKEKHRDKDKEKDRDREKKRDKEKEADKSRDKSKALDEKSLSGQPDPLGRRESRERNNSGDKKVPGQIGVHKVEKLTQNSNLVDESKFVKDFGRRIKDDATSTGNHVNSFSPVDRRKDEGLLHFESKDATTFAAIKETDKRAEVKPTDWKNTTRDGGRPGGNAMVQSAAATIQNNFEGLPRLLDRKMEGNENQKDKRGVKSQEKDKEKKSHGKDKDRDREKRKEDKDKKKEDREKRKAEKQKKKDEKQRKKEEKEKKREAKEEKSQVQNAELHKVKGSNHHDTDNHAVKPPQLPKQTNIIAPTEPNPKKRKDFETNGTVHAQDDLPNKLPRPSTSSSHPPLLENGRVLEHCQTSVPTPESMVIPNNNTKTENKEHKINGVTEAQPPSVSPMKTKPATDQTPKPSVRPPHPDAKYLSQIYSVPKIEDFLGYEDDEEEWLFGGGVSKKPKVEPSNSEEETPLVWAEARQIESADIFALPYVVPY